MKNNSILLKFVYLSRRQVSLLAILLLWITGCKKLVEVPVPSSSVNSDNVYSSDATAISVLTGIYTTLIGQGGQQGISGVFIYPELSADNFRLYQTTPGAYTSYYLNDLKSNSNTGGDIWSILYPVIYTSNAAIAGLTNNTKITPAVGKQLMGEALFMRAFCYFYLVNLYGDVPVPTGTDFTINQELPRTPKAQVYKQIVSDLISAEANLSDQFLDGTLLNSTEDRVRPTKWAAAALLARVYLFTNDWENAASQASIIIANNNLFNLTALSDVFLKNSNEAIFQLQPTLFGQNTPDGTFYIIPSTGLNQGNPAYLASDFVNEFEPGDQRLVNWVDTVSFSGVTYYYPFKYKVSLSNAAVTEYEMVLRLGEQYLIRAEALAQMGQLAAANNDVNVIRNRAQLPIITITNKNDLLKFIMHERRLELFAEGAHRWLDLKRTGTVDSVMSVATPKKGGIWNPTKQLYPIPFNDLQRDHHLIQNPGY